VPVWAQSDETVDCRFRGTSAEYVRQSGGETLLPYARAFFEKSSELSGKAGKAGREPTRVFSRMIFSVQSGYIYACAWYARRRWQNLAVQCREFENLRQSTV